MQEASSALCLHVITHRPVDGRTVSTRETVPKSPTNPLLFFDSSEIQDFRKSKIAQQFFSTLRLKNKLQTSTSLINIHPEEEGLYILQMAPKILVLQVNMACCETRGVCLCAHARSGLFLEQAHDTCSALCIQ
jgi:hypothetical protein